MCSGYPQATDNASNAPLRPSRCPVLIDCGRILSQFRVRVNSFLSDSYVSSRSGYHRKLKETLTLHVTGSQALSGWIVLASAASLILCALAKVLHAQIRFVWHAFIAPIGSADQRGRLEKVRQSSRSRYSSFSSTNITSSTTTLPRT